ncbi:unnamed protein product [Pleuronectes platessa]|uniref:Uncharacterized protein n=1 Tax=Pleuronectes platessa TaxID=8262 RepID=A0A9N7UAE8_PLEPL|nr:unnamed protein product [Pleuronectes platessa]
MQTNPRGSRPEIIQGRQSRGQEPGSQSEANKTDKGQAEEESRGKAGRSRRRSGRKGIMKVTLERLGTNTLNDLAEDKGNRHADIEGRLMREWKTGASVGGAGEGIRGMRKVQSRRGVAEF